MKDKEIIVQNLCLELSRKCNLNCSHCSRGNSENKEMSDKIIERVFEDIDGTMCLQFTGGETSLAVNKLKKVIEEIKKNNTIVRSVVVFTNAVDISDEYINCLKELQDYCETRNKLDAKKFDDTFQYGVKGIIPRLDSDYVLRVIVSLDKYHLSSIDRLSSREQVKQNVEKLVKNFAVEIDKICNYTVYNEGRAKNLQYIYKEETPQTKYAGAYFNGKNGYRDICYLGPAVQITYNGKIGDTNKTYVETDKNAVGNILEESIFSMFQKLQKDKKFKLSSSLNKLYAKFSKISHEFNTTTKALKRMQKYYIAHFMALDYSYFCDKTPGFKELDQTPNIPVIKKN